MGFVVAVFFLFSVAVAFTLNKNLAQEDPNSLAEEYGLLNDEDENKLGLLDDENDEPGLSDDEDEFEPGLSDHKEENEAGLLNYMQNKKVRTVVCLESLAPTQSIVAFGEIYNKCPNTRGGGWRPSLRMWYISYLA